MSRRRQEASLDSRATKTTKGKEDPMNNDELLIDVLRAAGHGDAAELAGKVLAHREAPGEQAAPEEAKPPPDDGARGEDTGRAEGEALLATMNKSLTPWHDAGTV